MLRALWVTSMAIVLTLAVSSVAQAQLSVGPQASIGSDSGLGLGGRLIFPLRTSPLGIDGVIDGNYFFGGRSSVDSWIDTNVNVRVPVPLARDFRTRLGVGLNASFISEDTGGVTTDTSSEVGLNVLASIGLPRRNLAPYFELRTIIGGAEQVVLTGGLTVGPSR